MKHAGRHPQQSYAAPGIGALWLAACLVASYLAMAYDFRPGRLGATRGPWPSASAMTRRNGHATIVAFLHPRCVCTKATVKQLIRTVSAHPDAALWAAVFVPPEPADPHGWADSEYVQMVRAALPQAQIFSDRGGREASRFEAFTSGTILVYDDGGQEIFRGGITNRRGGEGDNPGLRRFAQVLGEGAQRSRAEASPVFGCPIIAPHPSQPRGVND